MAAHSWKLIAVLVTLLAMVVRQEQASYPRKVIRPE